MLPSMIKIVAVAVAMYGAFLVISARNEYRWLTRGMMARRLIEQAGMRRFKVIYMSYGALLIAAGVFAFAYLAPIVAEALRNAIGVTIAPVAHQSICFYRAQYLQ